LAAPPAQAAVAVVPWFNIKQFFIMKKALIIFVRRPQAGKVKSRLAATVGDEKALEIYTSLLQHTHTVAKEAAADKVVFYTGEIEQYDLWSDTGFIKKLQSNGNLGDKMSNAFEQLFNDGYQKILIIGSDCFELTPALIETAFAMLDHSDLVIGPAKDGGYYLLGMKKLYPFLFINKQWSTGTVYSDTILDFTTHQLTYKTLPALIDVDTEEDWLLTRPNKN
jgi:uncharacterized protein